MKTSVIGLVLGLGFILSSAQISTFEKNYLGRAANEVVERADGHFLMAGWQSKTTLGLTTYDALWIHTNTIGKEVERASFDKGGSEQAVAIQVMPDGSSVMAAKSQAPSSDFMDIWLIKLSASGVKIWDKLIDLGGNESVESLRLTSDGGFILAGTMLDNTAGDHSAFMLKTDANGTEEWSATYLETGRTTFGSHAIEITDGYILSGYSDNGSSTNLHVVKTSGTGAVTWTLDEDISAYDFGYEVVENPDGGFVVAGSKYGSQDEACLFLVNNDGDYLESKLVLGFGARSVAYSVKPSNSGGFMVTGKSTNSLSVLNWDVFISEMEDGWGTGFNAKFGGTGHDAGLSIIAASDGGFAVCGVYASGVPPKGRGVYLLRGDGDGEIFNPLGIQELTGEVNIFPNPIEDHLKIRLSESISGEKVEFELIDLTGKSLETSQVFPGSTIRFDRTGLVPGIYFYRISQDDQILKTGKLIFK